MNRWLLGFLFLLPSLAAAETVMYVQSAKAKILAQPNFDATVVTELGRGTKVDVVEAQARWVKVTADGKTGWASRFVLGDREPLDKVTVFGGEEESIDTNARRRASAVTTAGAARGLAAEDRQRANQAGLANYGALENMESVKVSEEEAISFLAEGLKQ